MKNERIQIEKNGKTVDCKVLFTFDCDENLKSYIGYTDNSYGKNGRKNIYVSSYDPLGLELKLEDITDEAELKMISEVLTNLDSQA